MLNVGRLRAVRIALLSLASLVAIPASLALRGVLSPVALDVPSIQDEERMTSGGAAAAIEDPW